MMTQQRTMTTIAPLVHCPRCEQYTNPEPIEEYERRTGPLPYAPLPGIRVCEYCGWKLRSTKP